MARVQKTPQYYAAGAGGNSVHLSTERFPVPLHRRSGIKTIDFLDGLDTVALDQLTRPSHDTEE